jgi:hypothetical protein
MGGCELCEFCISVIHAGISEEYNNNDETMFCFFNVQRISDSNPSKSASIFYTPDEERDSDFGCVSQEECH